MSYKDILVHVDSSDAGAKRMDAAVALASAHDAHLTAIAAAMTALPVSFGYAPLPADVVEAQSRRAREAAEDALSAAEEVARRNGVALERRVVEGLEGQVFEEIAVNARHTDLSVLGQPSDQSGPLSVTQAMLEEVMFASGRPVMLVPYIGAPSMPPKNILIAWDGGKEAARAINDALPLLTEADKATVLVIDAEERPERHGEAPGADMAQHLARHGVKVEAAHSYKGSIDVGSVLLSRISDLGADMLIMGGYGHSRLRQLVLGGVTRTVLGQMTVPVMMSH